MEQKFGKNSILGRAKRPSRADIEALREFCEGEVVTYRKGDQSKTISMIRKNITFSGRFPDHAEGEL